MYMGFGILYTGIYTLVYTRTRFFMGVNLNSGGNSGVCVYMYTSESLKFSFPQKVKAKPKQRKMCCPLPLTRVSLWPLFPRVICKLRKQPIKPSKDSTQFQNQRLQTRQRKASKVRNKHEEMEGTSNLLSHGKSPQLLKPEAWSQRGTTTDLRSPPPSKACE